VRADAADLVQALIDMGDDARNTLGQLPHAAYRESAEQGRLLAAVPLDGGTPLGYALFRLPRSEVALTHLCVRPDARNRGIARRLVEEISRLHGGRLGIRAKCRDDYGLEPAWTGLGFQRRGRAVGRGKDRAPMTVWWRDHGHPDLFTTYDQPVELRAAIDLNVLRDLAAPQDRGNRSDFLLSDELVGRLELVVTSGMRAEIDRIGGSDNPLRAVMAEYQQVSAAPDMAADFERRIGDAVREDVPDFPRTEQDRSDLLQVAHAAAACIGVFLTWDNGLIRRLGPCTERLAGMRIMAPDYVFVHLDELANAQSYQKLSLENSGYTTVRAAANTESELLDFVAGSAGETQAEFRKLLRGLARTGAAVIVVHAPDGRRVATKATVLDGEVLRVPLLRVADDRLAETVARHLLWTLRREARGQGARLLHLADPRLSARVVHAADFDSMINASGQWHAPVIDVCGSAADVAAAAVQAYSLAGLGAPPLLGPNLSAHVGARLEQAWWPAKIIDSELPCFAVPIKALYSTDLFGYPEPLTLRPPQLSLGREHVYYHSAANSVLRAPARILWYASGDRRTTGSGHFFGVSRLDGITRDTPEQLHAALSYYGVFDVEAIKQAALGKPKAEALRLSDTELFAAPVSLRRYQALLGALGGGATNFPSARKLSPQLYAAVYADGMSSANPVRAGDKMIKSN